jgi:hypothetical protein
MIFKIAFTVALFAAHFCAQAQTAYIGKTSIENLKIIDYKRYPQAERLVDKGVIYYIEWTEKKVWVDGDPLPIQDVKKSGNSVSIKYGIHLTVTLILSYDLEGKCIGYKFEI